MVEAIAHTNHSVHPPMVLSHVTKYKQVIVFLINVSNLPSFFFDKKFTFINCFFFLSFLNASNSWFLNFNLPFYNFQEELTWVI